MAEVKTEAVKSNMMVDVVKAGESILRLSKYKAGETLAADTVIEAVPVPEGAIITRIDLAWSAFGASRTLSVGDNDSAIWFFNGLDVSAAGVATLLQDGQPAGVNHQYDDQNTINITVLGGSMPEDAWIVCNVEYKMAGGFPDEDFA